MNNSLASCTATSVNLDDRIIQAALLIEQAVKNGSVRIHHDRSITVNGLPLPKLTPSQNGKNRQPSDCNTSKFQFDGEVWTIQFDGKVIFESDRLGLHYIQTLIQNEGEEVHATELVGSAYGEAVDVMNP